VVCIIDAIRMGKPLRGIEKADVWRELTDVEEHVLEFVRGFDGDPVTVPVIAAGLRLSPDEVVRAAAVLIERKAASGLGGRWRCQTQKLEVVGARAISARRR